MKKVVWIGISMGLLAAAWWAAWTGWRAHRDIVSLNVTEALVKDVVRSLERQSRERIVLAPDVRGRITLALSSVPLEEALNAVARQAGALSGAVHAVYDKDSGLAALETVLARNGSIEEANWTTVVPDLSQFPNFPPDSPMPDGGSAGPGKRIRRIVQDARVTGDTQDEQGPGPAEKGRDQDRTPGRPLMVMRFQTADGTGKVESRVWTPERIVMAPALAPRFTGQKPSQASRAKADDLARRLGAKCATLYVLGAGPDGEMDVTTRVPGQNIMHGSAAAGPPPNEEQLMNRAEAGIRREKLAQYQDLTPEQRVERLRSQRDTKVKIRQQAVERSNP